MSGDLLSPTRAIQGTLAFIVAPSSIVRPERMDGIIGFQLSFGPSKLPGQDHVFRGIIAIARAFGFTPKEARDAKALAEDRQIGRSAEADPLTDSGCSPVMHHASTST